jgi:hypothetical protein
LTLSQGCWLTFDEHEADGNRKSAILNAITSLVEPSVLS